MGEKVLWVGHLQLHHAGAGLGGDLFCGQDCIFDMGLRVRQALVHLMLNAGKRVTPAPLLDFFAAAVPIGVVGGRMRPHAVGHRLNQGGSATGAGTLHGFVQSGVHLLKVIAVNPVCGHAVPFTLRGDTCRAHLPGYGG